MKGGPETNIFVLADRLNKTPAEIRAMPYRDLVGLVNYYEVKGVLSDLQTQTELHRGNH